MSDVKPLLDIQHLSISFGQRQAVHDLNLQVFPGERLALVGESGSGKTVTALSVLRLLGQAPSVATFSSRGRTCWPCRRTSCVPCGAAKLR